MRSRVGWLLAALHAAWFFLAVANMSPPSTDFVKFLERFPGFSTTLFAGRPFHYAYESPLLQLLLLIDVPAALALLPVSLALSLLWLPFARFAHPSLSGSSYVGAALVLLAATCQWVTIGRRIERRLEARKWGRRVNELIRKRFVLIVGTVALAALILTPIVNERSRVRAHARTTSR
jgi:hypothetical protein